MLRALPLALLIACGSLKDPASVADKFVDKYYVESDQQAALALASGLARVRLEQETKLVGAARRGIAPGSHAAKVYYKRTSLAGQGAARIADYALQIRPQGGAAIQRTASLELAAQPDGTWRVTKFTETSPR